MTDASNESIKRLLIVQAVCGFVAAAVAVPFVFRGEPFEVSMLMLPPAGAVFAAILPAAWGGVYAAMKLVCDLTDTLTAGLVPDDEPLTWRESIRTGIGLFVGCVGAFVALVLLSRSRTG